MGIAIFYIFGTFGLFTFFLHYKAQKVLKTKYPQVWLNIGEPDLFIPQKDVIMRQMIWKDYLKNKEYLSLDDPKFERLCNHLRFVNKISYFLLAAFFVLMYVFVIKQE